MAYVCLLLYHMDIPLRSYCPSDHERASQATLDITEHFWHILGMLTPG